MHNFVHYILQKKQLLVLPLPFKFMLNKSKVLVLVRLIMKEYQEMLIVSNLFIFVCLVFVSFQCFLSATNSSIIDTPRKRVQLIFGSQNIFVPVAKSAEITAVH
jgi:hypothetical protein